MEKIKVLGKTWSVVLLSEKLHGKRYGDCHAIAFLESRKIYVRPSSLNIQTLSHELIHSYQFELSYWELELDDEQVSEWFAELFCRYGDQILKDAKELCQKLS